MINEDLSNKFYSNGQVNVNRKPKNESADDSDTDDKKADIIHHKAVETTTNNLHNRKLICLKKNQQKSNKTNNNFNYHFEYLFDESLLNFNINKHYLNENEEILIESKLNNLMQDILLSKLKKYDANEAAKCSLLIANQSRLLIKSLLDLNIFKFTVNVILLQKLKQSVIMASKCFSIPYSDKLFSAVYQTEEYASVVIIFASQVI